MRDRFRPAFRISIHALLAEGDQGRAGCRAAASISIHALLAEGDVVNKFTELPKFDFYPRPPRGGRPRTLLLISTHTSNFYPRPPRGGRLRCVCGILGVQRFLSTPSSRRATYRFASPICRSGYFYPRPPRGGRPYAVDHCGADWDISIHALLAEGDSRSGHEYKYCFLFLSTPSSRRATPLLCYT